MMVFTKHGLKERINLCLFFQSLADLAFMTTNFFLYSDSLYVEITGGVSRGSPLTKFFINNYLPGLYGFTWASGFMAMVIACERCFCVLSPLRAQNILKTKSTLVIILVAFFLIVSAFFVVTVRWRVVCVFDSRTNTTYEHVYPGQFYLHNKKLIDTMDGVVYGIVLPGTFVLVITIATIVTVSKLKQMALWREKASSAVISVRDVALTRMLIGCSVLFVVCAIPGVVFRVLILFVPEVSLEGRYRNTFRLIFSVTDLGAYVNSSFNFFIYYTMGTKYKATLNAMCCGRKGKKQPSETGAGSTVLTDVK